MIDGISYNIPQGLPSVTAANAWTKVDCVDGSLFRDVTRQRNLPLELKLDNAGGNVGRILAQVVNNKVNVNQLSQEFPHFVKAAFTVTYDPKLASTADLIETVRVLMSTLLGYTESDSTLTVLRLLNGEK